MVTRARALLLLVLVSALGCHGDEDRLAHSVLSVCLRLERPLERVFRTAEEWQTFAGPVARGPVPVPDFGQQMVVARFDGPGSACAGFTVDGVEADAFELVVLATRHTSPDPCVAVIAYPQLLLAVERRDLPVRFQIRDATDRVPGAGPACM